ncbi:hypothetical protein [Mesorhizobium sp.]|uniref:hypothetical protein n=1 Tax=Mesorhizobium sp. TaxID=1871066 RepID=UPI00257EBD9E|nr:hypothetical protein [Mesorhizobium sp.]
MQRDAAFLRGVGQCKCRPDAGRSAGDQHRLAGEVAKVGMTKVGVTRVEVTGAVVVAGIPPGLSCSSQGLAVLMFKSVEVQGRK